MSNHLHLVDRHFHERPGQAAPDTLKNRILAKSGTPILRLCTIESGIKEKIADFVAQWASTALDA